MSDYQPRPMTISLDRAERVLGVSSATIMAWGKAGQLQLDGGTVAISELERFLGESTDPRYPPPQLARALSVLPRFQSTYTTSQAADIIGCSRDVVVRLCDQGHLQHYTLQSGIRRITREAMAAYLTDNPGAQAMKMGLVRPAEAGTTPKPRRKRRTKRAAAS